MGFIFGGVGKISAMNQSNQSPNLFENLANQIWLKSNSFLRFFFFGRGDSLKATFKIFLNEITSLSMFLCRSSSDLLAHLRGRMEDEGFSLPLSQDTFQDLWENV